MCILLQCIMRPPSIWQRSGRTKRDTLDWLRPYRTYSTFIIHYCLLSLTCPATVRQRITTTIFFCCWYEQINTNLSSANCSQWKPCRPTCCRLPDEKTACQSYIHRTYTYGQYYNKTITCVSVVLPRDKRNVIGTGPD